MTLADAIRLGSMLKPQSFTDLLEIPEETVTLMGEAITVVGGIHTCALGAALDAVGKLPTMTEWMEFDGKVDDMFTCFPEYSALVACPVTEFVKELGSLVAELNDKHHWTRQRIADWVESVVLALPAATPREETRQEAVCV